MKPKLLRQTLWRHPQRGVSLVELMIALALGLVISGVVFASYLGSRQAQRTSTALGQMTENANLAFNLMRRYISLAGYSTVTGINTNGLTRSYSGKAIFGCSQAFTSTVSRGIDNLTCKNDNKQPQDAISVTYQATSANALMRPRTNGAANEPSDMLGRVLHPSSVPQYLAEARFTISTTGDFQVNGNGGATTPPAGDLPSPETLFDGVVDMRVWYGLSSTVSGKPDQIVTRYVDATDIGVVTNADWNNVSAVRVCLLLASTEQVMEAATDYYGCDAQVANAPAVTTPTDRRLYKAYTTTIYLPNRLGG